MNIQKTLEKLRASGAQVALASDVKPILEWVQSGSLLLNMAMGTRGYPISKIIEIYGKPSVGKSILALVAEANVTKQGKYVIHCDLENDFSHAELNLWRQAFGVDMNFVVDIPAQPAEDVINTVRKLLKDLKSDCKLLVVDAIGAMTSEKMLERKAEEAYIPDNPKYVGQFCRSLNSENNTAAVLLLNHVMANIGGYGPQTVSKGGYALKHFASLRLEVTGKPIVDTTNEFGFASKQQIDVVVQKNKLGRPRGKALGLIFDFDLGGFDRFDEVITLAAMMEPKLIEPRPGGTYIFPGMDGYSIRGRDNVKTFLQERRDVMAWLVQVISGYTLEDLGW